MAHVTRESLSCQVELVVDDLDLEEGLPFQHLLSREAIMAALETADVGFRERIYTPMVTLWAFLSQVIAKKESSCEDAVSRVLAERVARGQKACSPDSSSYCEARGGLPLRVVEDLTRNSGRNLHQKAESSWLWKGRHVKIVDGSTATMADTVENQAEFPQSRNQKEGLGFPILRLVVCLSLSVGTVLECAMGACRGKKTGEQSLFRKMWNLFESGDILLGDRLYDAFRDIALLKKRGVDVVFGKKQSRRCDFRCGQKFGSDDHVVVWVKPKYDAARFESKTEWEALPGTLEMREVRATIRRKGYRNRKVVIVTTLTAASVYSAKDLTDLFAQRWHCELDLRSIKRSLGMHHLRCKTPDMVRKELWTYLLAYNLIRVRMAQAAAVHGVLPRKLSFTAAKNHIHNFAPYQNIASEADQGRLESELLRAISRHRVGNRPGRKEPRAVKKREQKYSYLTKPRVKARQGLPA
jgi:hypothetical protein